MFDDFLSWLLRNEEFSRSSVKMYGRKFVWKKGLSGSDIIVLLILRKILWCRQNQNKLYWTMLKKSKQQSATWKLIKIFRLQYPSPTLMYPLLIKIDIVDKSQLFENDGRFNPRIKLPNYSFDWQSMIESIGHFDNGHFRWPSENVYDDHYSCRIKSLLMPYTIDFDIHKALANELLKMVFWNNLRTSLLDPPKRDITIQVWPLIKSRVIIAHDLLANTNVN